MVAERAVKIDVTTALLLLTSTLMLLLLCGAAGLTETNPVRDDAAYHRCGVLWMITI